MYRAERHDDSPNSTLFTQQDRADAAAHARRLESTNPERGERDNDFATIQLDKEHKSTSISQEDIDHALFGTNEDKPRREDLKIHTEITDSREIISVIDSQTGDTVLIKKVPIGSIQTTEYDDFCEGLITMAFDVVVELWHAEKAEKAAFKASYASYAAKALKKPARRHTRSAIDELIVANADPWGR